MLSSRKAHSIIYVTFFLLSITARAQLKRDTVYQGDKLTLDTTVHTYLADTLLNKFVGEWQWKAADTTIYLTFEKMIKEFGSERRELKMELLKVQYQMIVNDVVVTRTLDSMFLVGSTLGDKNILYVNIRNFYSGLNFPLEFVFVSSDQILMQISKKSRSRITQGFVFQMPLNINFHRKSK